MPHFCRLVAVLFAVCLTVSLPSDARDKKPAKPITWKKIVLDKEFRSEGVGVADVNKDGRLDVIVGDCWYEAPKDAGGPWKRHILREYFHPKLKKNVPADRAWSLGVYTDAFCCFTDDFNGDGWADVIVIPFPGTPCYWYENPGDKGGLWRAHLLTNAACNETPIFVDLFKTGKKVLVMGWNPAREDGKGNYNDRGEMCYFIPGQDPTKPWNRISISGPSEKGKMVPGTQQFSHGLGHGDVNGDGRVDILVPQGWWEQPEKIDDKPWKFHPTTVLDEQGKAIKTAVNFAHADMFTYPMSASGKPAVIATSAHNYGFWWHEQRDGNTFVQHKLFIDPFEVARFPASPQFPYTAEQKKMYDAVTSVRVDHFKRSPFAASGTLFKMAQDHAERLAKSGDKEANIAGEYNGKVVAVKTGRFTTPTDEVKKKDQLTSLQKFALSLLPDNEKDRDLVLPGFEIGVGAAKVDGAMQVTVILGDRKLFSLPSQTHALHKVDIDGDGLPDFVTGRRWWAHGPRGDAGPNDPAYLYWFQAKRAGDGSISFIPHVIDDDSGVGTGFAIADMNGDGRPDVIVANKKGVHVFLQQR